MITYDETKKMGWRRHYVGIRLVRLAPVVLSGVTAYTITGHVLELSHPALRDYRHVIVLFLYFMEMFLLKGKREVKQLPP
jgi:hypothetical protein